LPIFGQEAGRDDCLEKTRKLSLVLGGRETTGSGGGGAGAAASRGIIGDETARLIKMSVRVAVAKDDKEDEEESSGDKLAADDRSTAPGNSDELLPSSLLQSISLSLSLSLSLTLFHVWAEQSKQEKLNGKKRKP